MPAPVRGGRLVGGDVSGHRVHSFGGDFHPLRRQIGRDIVRSATGSERAARLAAVRRGSGPPSEFADRSESAREAIAACFAEWEAYLVGGFAAMRADGLISTGIDPAELAVTVMTALQTWSDDRVLWRAVMACGVGSLPP